MNIIKATVKRGRLELNVPADWPDGIEVEIHPVGQPGKNNHESMATDDSTHNEKAAEESLDAGWSNTPEVIAEWLRGTTLSNR